MCGICGIFEYGRSGPANLAPAGPMTDALAHRGPNGRGVWTGERVALGHRRLSIFDLSPAGAQPMRSPDGKVTVTFNGEIFNFKELREPLEKEGRRFSSSTDTEVLIAHYQRHGIEGISSFRGMFAFALWDENLQTLFIVRDRLGIKPLYYLDEKGILVFASELKSLLRHPEVNGVLDHARLIEWLALRYTTAPGTLFQGVKKLEPGHYLAITKEGARKVCYWDLQFSQTTVKDPEQALEEFEHLFRESVRLWMQADVPVGIFLSGGLDSSSVALEAAQLASGPLETFTVGFHANPDYSELERARLVSKHLGTNHRELILDEVDPEILRSVVWHLEEPVGDPATVLIYKLSEFARRHVTVVLMGEGSDETNLGYAKARAYQRWSDLSGRPLLGPLLGKMWLSRNVPEAVAAANVDEAGVYAELSWPGAAQRAAMLGDKNGEWLAGLRRTLLRASDKKRLARLLYLDIKGWMGDDLLLKVDKTTMAFGLEARVPFLEHKLVEWSMSLPPRWKLGPRGTKLLLRNLVRNRLPAGTVDGPQHGFLAPLSHWFAGGWSNLIDRSLGSDGLGKRGIFPQEYLESIRQGIRQEKREALKLGFMLASLETWFQLFSVEIGSPVSVS